MNLRFWGGWFLAIAGISILLTMGCEKGALGVKPATIVGQVVDKDNPSIPVANAVVRMISKEAVGTSELVQGNNFVSAVTGVDGKFVFESVQADNVVFEYSAPGYASMIYPKPSSGDDESEGSTAEIEFVSVRSGAFLDLRMLPLMKLSNPLPSSINVRIDLIDSMTKSQINGNFWCNINGAYATTTADILRSVGIENVRPGSTIPIRVGEYVSGTGPMRYLSREDISVNGTSDVYIKVELEPVTYQLSLRYLNVPSYIVGSQAVVNFFAEIPATATKPAQIVKQWKKQNFENMDVIDLPGLYLADPNGLDLRIQVQGYDDEIVKFDRDSFKMGTAGIYRLDIDFRKKLSGITYPTGTVVGLYDNLKRRNLRITVANLQANYTVRDASIMLPNEGGPTYSGSAPRTAANSGSTSYQISAAGSVYIDFTGVAVGYTLPYTFTVDDGLESYSVSKSNVVIPEEIGETNTSSTYNLSVNWSVEYDKLKTGQ
ncbi:hypothetical protein MASR1M12_25300 [Erysipelotrichia bacterium]